MPEIENEHTTERKRGSKEKEEKDVSFHRQEGGYHRDPRSLRHRSCGNVSFRFLQT
jgi:hypothetical protein